MNTSSDAPLSEVEVGADGDGLRYWLAVERCRLAELALTGQTNNLAALETRATSILAWSATSFLALAAMAAQGRLVVPALTAGVPLLFAASCCAAVLWPAGWGQAGYWPSEIETPVFETELEYRESFTSGYQANLQMNSAQLKRSGRLMRVAWVCFLAAGPAAAWIRAAEARHVPASTAAAATRRDRWGRSLRHPHDDRPCSRSRATLDRRACRQPGSVYLIHSTQEPRP